MKKYTTRRQTIIGGAAMATVLSSRASAQTKWPERPITLLHGFAAGGNADVIARLVAEQLTARLGQPVIVEPKSGAGGRIAAAQAAKATPDGYTLAILPGGHAIAAAMFEGLPYDTVEDFSFISMLTDFPFLMVTYPEHPARTLPEFITAAKAAPQPLLFGSAGSGTGQHLSGVLLSRMAGIELQHLPFRGGSPGAQEVLGKRIDVLFETPTLLLELVKSGQLRALGVTGSKRFFALPDVPAIGEVVGGYETSSWLGLAGPPRLPADIAAKLSEAVANALQDSTLQERFKALGNLPAPTTAAAFKSRVQADVTKWTRVVADAGIARVKLQ